MKKAAAKKVTGLIVRDHSVPKGSALAKSEQDLYEAMSGAFESFYSQGVILNRINIDREYKDAGFESFADYMNERQPCGVTERHSWRLIAAMKIRPLLPQVTDSVSGAWTEWAIRPLLHKDFTPADQKRLGGKIATRVKHGEKLTASLVKKICDDDRGVDKQKAEKERRVFKMTETAVDIIEKIEAQASIWIKALGDVSSEFWSDAQSDKPGCAKAASKVVSKLASILSGK